MDHAAPPASTVTVLDAETSARIGPLDVMKLVADDAAGATFDAPLIGEQDPPVVQRAVAGRRTAIDALLALAEEAGVRIDNSNVRSIPIDAIGVQ
jgi:hypothetical protein